MTIGAIAGVGSGAASTFTQGAASAPTQAGGVDFSKALDGVSESLVEADELGQKLATGELTDVHQFTAAAAKADVNFQLTVAMQRRAVEAFQEVMRMQV